MSYKTGTIQPHVLISRRPIFSCCIDPRPKHLWHIGNFIYLSTLCVTKIWLEQQTHRLVPIDNLYWHFECIVAIVEVHVLWEPTICNFRAAFNCLFCDGVSCVKFMILSLHFCIIRLLVSACIHLVCLSVLTLIF